ncbi:transcriptional regulator, TetR family [Desulfonatronum zhilinae]|nr:transcriptional regulator, TetR family [Desulfonatronum zhilinae]
MANTERRNGDVKERLIAAAGELFAARGYQGATVRDICRKADAHVGAVNYHFRDKQGLFAATLEHAHQWSVRKYPPDAGLGPKASAEERLRAFIRSFLLRVVVGDAPDWHGRLMAREMAEPSEALSRMVRNSIHPLYLYLADIVRELLAMPRDEDNIDETIFLCSMSVTSQCLLYFTSRHVIAALYPTDVVVTDVERLTDHITRFSLGGIRAVADGPYRRAVSPAII